MTPRPWEDFARFTAGQWPLWAVLMIVMVGVIIDRLLDGDSFARAITLGLFFGPGWLALAYSVSAIFRTCGWRGERGAGAVAIIAFAIVAVVGLFLATWSQH